MAVGYRRRIPFQNSIGNKGTTGVITLAAPSTSWWASAGANLTFVSLLRLQVGATFAAGARWMSRESVTNNGTNLSTDATVGNGMRCVVNRGTTDLTYRANTTLFDLPGRWVWQVTCINTGAGTGLKVAFYKKPLNPAGAFVNMGVNGTPTEGSGTVAHGTGNPLYLLNNFGNVNGGTLDICFFGALNATLTQAQVILLLEQLEAGGLLELATRGRAGIGSSGLATPFKLAVFPGTIWAGAKVLDVIGGLTGPITGPYRSEGIGPLSGAQLTLSLLRSIPSAPGGLVVVTPNAGSMAMTGAAPTATPGTVTVTPNAGSAAFIGTNPSVAVGAVTKTPSDALLTFVGASPTVTKGAVTVTPSAPALTFTGAAPTLTHGAITATPSVASFAFTGTNPGVSAGTIVTPNAGVITMTGAAPAVTLGALTLTPTGPSLVFTGAAPAVTIGAVTVTPNAGVATFTGTAPTVTIGARTVTPTAPALIFSSAAPTATIGAITATPTAPALTFTGTNPTVGVGAVSLTLVGPALTFTGANPVVTGGSIFTPNAGAMAFTAAAPTVTASAASQVVLAIQDVSVPGYALRDRSVPAFHLTDCSLPGFALVDRSVPCYEIVDASGPGFALTDWSEG